MGIFKNFMNFFNIGTGNEKLLDLNSRDFINYFKNTNSNVTNEATYYTCLKILGETLGKLSLRILKKENGGGIEESPTEDLSKVINRPNPFMSPSIFWATVENNRNHYGNAYVFIEREVKKLKYGMAENINNLWILPSEFVTLLIDSQGIYFGKGDIYYKFSNPETGENHIFKNSDIMHFKSSHTFNGIIGKSIREVLAEMLQGNLHAQRYLSNLYERGLTASAVLEVAGELSPEKIMELAEEVNRQAGGSKGAGRVIGLHSGMSLKPLSITLADAQFFELKKLNTLQIASVFGIKPNHVNDYEKSSYANSEAQNLTFYVDTILYILRQYEDEINEKLLNEYQREQGYYVKFNEKAILRTDNITQAEMLAKYVNNGIYTINEARAFLNMPHLEDCDQPIVNGNYIPIGSVGEQYKSGVDLIDAS